jgi:hypothetical protein
MAKNHTNKQNEKHEHRIHRDRLIASIALAILFFIVGILIGYAITQSKIAKVDSMENQLRFDMMSMELESAIASESPCFADPRTLEEALDSVTMKISFLENQLGKDSPKVLDLKKYYSLLEIRHYIYMKERKEKCGGENYSLVLFFYSNKPENIDAGEKQGYVLDYLKDKYTLDKIKVYSLDYDLDIGVIKSLIHQYNITETPSMLIDGSLYLGFHDKEELEKLIS